MKREKFIIIFLVIIAFIYFFRKTPEYYKDFPGCSVNISTTSPGLLSDASLVCSSLGKKTPELYFENVPSFFKKDAWFFPNLDMTNFNLKMPDNIACKTRQTYFILSTLFPEKNVVYTGFTSKDRYNKNIEKDYTRFLHNPGKSPFKNTLDVIRAWKNNPSFPMLTIICRDEMGLTSDIKKLGIPSNITLINKHLSEEELYNYYNSHSVHICPSAHEGFGHYIHEAKSCEAVVLYTDAPPMNETFDVSTGIPIRSVFSHMRNGICPVYSVPGLEEAVRYLLSLPLENRQIIGQNARQAFLESDKAFKEKLRNVINLEIKA
jgi:glycosyltransferase involved in cell wall biosynthesis